MLFNEKLEESIIIDAKKYAEEKMGGAKLVFSSVVGSISQGGHYVDSDFDTRFLFLRNDFSNNLRKAVDYKEKELVKRYYPNNKVYEWIPFWELSSFLSFLEMPKFADCEISMGLYNIVDWTLMSPYTWDPYGLQQKLLPIIRTIFVPENKICAQRNVIKKFYNEIGAEDIIVKSYFYMVYAAAQIEFMCKYKDLPPVDVRTLLVTMGHDVIWNELNAYLTRARESVTQFYEQSGESIILQGQHFKIKDKRNLLFEKYIDKWLNETENIKPRFLCEDEIGGKINQMCTMVSDTISNVQYLGYAS